MVSQRQEKFGRLLQRDLGEIFQRDTKHHFGGAFITVTKVRISPDLSVAYVYLSFLLAKDAQALLQDINEKNKIIRLALANRIRNQVRIVPELRFHIDDSADEAARIEKLLEMVKKPSPNVSKLSDLEEETEE
jgi:ribosome-binding factor A